MQRSSKYLLCLLSLVIAIGLWLQATVIQVPSGTWAPSGSMAEVRSGAASVLLQDGTILVTGGAGASEVLSSAEFFSAGSFATAPAMNVTRKGHTAVMLQDGRVLVAGGKTTGDGVTNAAEVYSPALNSWIVIASMADARSGHTAVLLKDGRVLLAGGEGSAGAVSTLEVFDPIAGTFTFAGTMSSARKNHAAALLGDGKVLIAGGSNGSNALAFTEIYDPETGAVTSGPALSMPRAGLSATTLMDGNILIAGGNNGTADLATNEIFNSTTGIVSVLNSSLATARRDHSAFLLPNNNHVLIVGGTSGGTALATAELFRPWDGNFHSTGAMSAPRAGFSGSPLAMDGLFLVAGGIGTASSELYGFATIKTDKDDYLPGELVIMTGSGWQPGETVTLFLHEINNPEPHDDLTLTAVADAAGRIVNNQFAPDEHDNGVRFYLTATGASSQAQTTFTDGTPQVDSVSNSPLSPNQATSVGIKDSTDILAKNQGGGSVSDFRIRIHAVTIGGTLVREFLCGTISGNATCTQTWDGKNSAASFVADGTYFALASSGTTETTTPTSRIGTIVVDNTNPTISLLAPANGATVTGNFKLEATPIDAGGNDSNIDKVEFYIDSILVDTDTNSGSGWTTNNLTAASFSSGSHTWFAKAFDKAGNNAPSSSRTFNVGIVDTTPPVITPNISGTLGNNGWYVSNVTVSWTVTDPESSISSTTGCGTTNVPADTAGTSFTCQATSGGGTSSQSVTVKRDATAPTLAFGAASPAANANGWNNTNVSFPFTTADNLSGVASSTPASPLQLMTEGSSLTGSVTVTDMAGNSATFTSAPANIDKTKPTSSAAASPAANAAGWNNTDVTVTFSGSDSLSGLDSCTSAAILSTEGAGQSASGTCTDKAGNVSDPAVKNGINIDKTKPTASAAASPAANAAGWNNTDVTVSFTGLDGLSGIDSCTSATTLSAEAAGQSASGTCTDKAGNVSDSATKSGINIDKTKPTLAFGAASPAANGNGWNNSDVSFSFTPADALSGVASTSPAASPLVLVAEGSGVTATVTVTDLAGNSDTFTSPAVKIDKTAPTISGSRNPAGNAFGWNNTNVTVSFSCTDGLSGLAAGSPPADTLVTSEGANQSVDGTCHDQAGNTASTQVSGINIDKTKPTASAAASPAANAAGWNNTDVTVSFTGLDDRSGIDTCASAVTLSAEAASQSASGTCTDKAGNVSDSATKSGIKIDKTKPTLAFGAASPGANANGWNNTNVSFSFTTADNLSGVASSNPVSPLVLMTEGSSVTGSVLVTDVAGNSDTFTSPAVKIDKTAPTISGSRSPAGNAFGWNNTNVTVSFSCTDGLSGLAAGSPPADTAVASEGTNQSVDGTCHDQAGNTASTQVSGINIDKTKPTASAAASPAANAAGWNNTNVTVTFTGADALSGIETCVAPTVLTAEGVGQSASGNCTDKAGNQSDTATVNGIKIDKTKPMLTFGAASPAPNANGWNNTNVSFSFTTSDTLSGVASSSPASPLTVWTEGSAVTGSVLVTDVAGNSQTFVSPAVMIDKTAPAITGSRFPLANAYGWNKTDVTVSFGCTDTLSGVFTAPVSPVPLSTEGESQMVPGSCADYAGNSSAAMVGPINIDKTVPALPANVLANPAAIATQGTLTALVSDSLSKIIKAEFTVNGGSILLMNPATGSFPGLSVNVTATIPLQPVGVYNLCVRAQDRAENYSGEECTLFAVYDPNGGFVTGGGWINSPLGAYVMDPTLTGKANFGFVSKYQKGATLPVGETEFQFKAGDLNFHSSAYEWLVIAGAKAQYKGSGTINGGGNYGFILTATDGQINGGGGVDKFRMKIQDKASGEVVYDNQLGATDDATPSTAVGGGSIQVQAGKK